MHGARLYALAAANTFLLVDHVHAGFGILGNRLVFSGAHTLAALDAGLGFCTGSLCYNPNAGQGFVKFLVECFRAGTDTLQAGHAFSIFFYSELFHS